MHIRFDAFPLSRLRLVLQKLLLLCTGTHVIGCHVPNGKYNAITTGSTVDWTQLHKSQNWSRQRYTKITSREIISPHCFTNSRPPTVWFMNCFHMLTFIEFSKNEIRSTGAVDSERAAKEWFCDWNDAYGTPFSSCSRKCCYCSVSWWHNIDYCIEVIFGRLISWSRFFRYI